MRKLLLAQPSKHALLLVATTPPLCTLSFELCWGRGGGARRAPALRTGLRGEEDG
jgi:hypothetical protein